MIRSLPQLVVLLFSIVFHEVAHGRIALARGDTSARDAGRLTLNPIPHIDLFGTILLPLFLIITRSPVLFGWAKPVPVNPWQFRDSKKDMALVGASGPASNLILAIGFAIVFKLSSGALGLSHMLTQTVIFGVAINLVLAVFNLIPIPPLDGSRIVLAFLPDEIADRYIQIERYGFLIIFGLLFLGAFRMVIWPVVFRLMLLLVGREGLLVMMNR
jgi:Zn-dependent protease